MSGSLSRLQREVLEEELAELSEEYKAVHRQLGHTLDEAEKVRLGRRGTYLEQRIQEVDAKLAKAGSAGPGRRRARHVTESEVTSSAVVAVIGICLIVFVCLVGVIAAILLMGDRKKGLPPVEAIPPASATAVEAVPNAARIPPDQAVRDYYQLINERRYEEAWARLTPEFQARSPSYQGYTDWWDQVKRVSVGSVEVISESDTKPVVRADLWYDLFEGGTIKDDKPNIQLVYDSGQREWLFGDKW